jgi:hypothetical protein
VAVLRIYFNAIGGPLANDTIRRDLGMNRQNRPAVPRGPNDRVVTVAGSGGQGVEDVEEIDQELFVHCGADIDRRLIAAGGPVGILR